MAASESSPGTQVCFIGLALLVLSAVGLAQGPSPALVVKQNDKYQEMILKKLDIDVRIHGFLAETTSTMTFHNPHDRILEGDMYFPLPQGATVNGYALDLVALKDMPGDAVTMTTQRIAVYGDEGVEHAIKTLGFEFDSIGRADLNAWAIADYDGGQGFRNS